MTIDFDERKMKTTYIFKNMLFETEKDFKALLSFQKSHILENVFIVNIIHVIFESKSI